MKKIAKLTSIALVIVMICSLLAACGTTPSTTTPTKVEESPSTSPSQSAPPAEKVKMTVSSFCVGNDAFLPAWQELLNKFQSENPNVEIVDDSAPDANDTLRTKIKTAFAAGTEPDFMWFYNGADADPLIASGRLLSLDEEVSKDTEWSGKIAPAALESGKRQGKQYSIPVVGFYEALFCNKDLFDANGLSIPTNWDEMLKAVDTFKSKDIIPVAASIDESYYLLEYAILSQAGKDGHNSEFKGAVPADWAKGIDVLKDLYQKGAFPKDSITATDEQVRQLFYNKKAAMMINGSWCVGQVTEKDNTVITYVPVVPDGKADAKSIIGGYGTGFYVSKPANDSKSGMPVKLLKFFTSPENVAILTKDAGIPGVKLEGANLSPVAKSGIDMLGGASSVNFPLGDRIDKEAFTNMRKQLAYVVTGKMTSQKLLEDSLNLVK